MGNDNLLIIFHLYSSAKVVSLHFPLSLDIPKELREESMQLGIILMPDENREALKTILAFLRDFAVMSNENQVLHFASVPSLVEWNKTVELHFVEY